MDEPRLNVGLLLEAPQAELAFDGVYRDDGGQPVPQTLTATVEGGERRLVPDDPETGSFLLKGMTVGVAFHWEHQEDLRFRGALSVIREGGGLTVINEVPLEEYLVSVISSEMSARCPDALLRAHAIISRSWLLAQLEASGQADGGSSVVEEGEGIVRIRRWYDREDHARFDVCADDHCQRYQGITRSFSAAAREAVEQTRGMALVHGGRVCDARFAKCCGGMTERFSSAWGDEDVPYLQAFPDGPPGEAPFDLPLTEESRAASFIDGAPAAFCNTKDRDLLERILPELDHDTVDFYRWETRVEQEPLRGWVVAKAGIDPGPVRALEPVSRGPSGRLVELDIVGEALTLRVGKELEIRRLLSETHLYSSAFTVRPEAGDPPAAFLLRGAGWGHGVGLCQIGAAVMAAQGADHGTILAHYYRGAALETLYK